MQQIGKFKFRKEFSFGANDAEEDIAFLTECFHDIGDIDILRDCTNPKRIIVGRSGIGKSALLIRFKELEERGIEIKPESLALSYISNSTILNYLAELGVHLDVFFKLLWRHVFTVEILKKHFSITNEEKKANFISFLKGLFSDKKHEKAVRYLEEWGKSFWEDTEYRIKEVTTKLENDLQLALGAKMEYVNAGIDSTSKLASEEKAEVLHKAQNVVNVVQVRELSEILELLNDVLSDPQKKYYILIDRLDENWVEEKLRYRMIKSLIETIKDFRVVSNVKIIAAIRLDLLERVFRFTRTSGFQEEKYESLYLHVEWNRGNLKEIINKRIQFMLKDKYTKKDATYKDIFPERVNKQDVLDYILDRTLCRPRDVISFLNFCLLQAINKSVITAEMIKKAEVDYSNSRLKSVCDEWYDDYPNLQDILKLIKRKTKIFTINDIDDMLCEEIALKIATENIGKNDAITRITSDYVNQTIPLSEFKRDIIHIFFLVGIVELKIESFERYVGFSDRRNVMKSQISDKTRIRLHQAFWNGLGVLLTDC